MNLGLDGACVLITGASGGIGRALAEAFAGEGAHLALTGHRGFDALERFIAGRPWRPRAIAIRADVTRPSDLEGAMERAAARFGRVDHCVANAGKWPEEALRLDRIDEARLRDTLEVNLLGSIWTARAFLAALARSGPRPDAQGASLTFIGSTAGRFGERGHADYATSKSALAGLTRTLKNEIVGIDPYARVNLVEPGWTITAMADDALAPAGAMERIVRTMPLRQLARAADIARVVVMLASPRAARHVSGEILTVAGGMEGRVQWELDEIDEAAIRDRLREDPD